jgi:outer membrane lipoprotein carrier protein
MMKICIQGNRFSKRLYGNTPAKMHYTTTTIQALCLSLCLVVCTTVVHAENDEPDFAAAFSCDKSKTVKDEPLTGKIQDSYNKVASLTAEFFQSSTLLGMNERIVSSGNLRFLKPGMMDWNYTSPSPQKFVTDGETVWYYEPSVNQLTIGSIGATFTSDVPVSFLLGIGDLSSSFSEEKICENSEGILLTLVPLDKDQSIKTFSLLVDSETYLPIGAKLVDTGDTITEFLFRETRTNSPLPPEEFTFSPPKGVDIVYN